MLGHRAGDKNSTNRPLLKGKAARAAARLKELATLASWRGQHGVLLKDPTGWAEVAAACLHELDGHGMWEPTPECLRAQMPPRDTTSISAEELAQAILKTAGWRRLHSGAEAGRMVELVDQERGVLEADGKVLRTLIPFDETAAARALRRAERRKLKTRDRVAKHRKSKRFQGANSVTATTCNIATSCNAAITNMGKRYTKTCNIREGSQTHRVLDAVAAGAATVSDIAAATGLGSIALRPVLARLKAGGALVQEGRGRYSLNVRRGLQAH